MTKNSVTFLMDCTSDVLSVFANGECLLLTAAKPAVVTHHIVVAVRLPDVPGFRDCTKFSLVVPMTKKSLRSFFPILNY